MGRDPDTGSAPGLPGADVDPDAGVGAPHARRVRRLAVTGLVILGVLVLVLVVFAYLWSRDTARPVSLEEARRRFLEERTRSTAVEGPRTPADGVYQYVGSGSEELSSPPKSQSEGPAMPGTVQHGEHGCWSFRLDYSTNSWRRWEFCSDAAGLFERGTKVFQRWDFVVTRIDNVARMHCKPPAVIIETGMQAGDSWQSRCEGTNTSISGTTVTTTTHHFVGRDSVTVGGRTVEALHFRDEGVVSGSQTGTESFELWMTEDGLIVKGLQRIVVDSDSPIGKVTYTQQGEFTLVGGPTKG